MTSLIGAAFGFTQEGFPFRAGQAVILKIGAGIFAAMVEKADIVVCLLEWMDFSFNERILFFEIGLQISWDIEIHESLSSFWGKLNQRSKKGHHSGCMLFCKYYKMNTCNIVHYLYIGITAQRGRIKKGY